MPVDSRSYLESRLTELRAEITKARKVQSYSVGQDLNVVRGQLKIMLEEEKWLLGEINKLDQKLSGGMANKVVFARPT